MDISIVIPTHNRARVLEETLRGFESLDSKGIPWELLVVDNRSSDGTKLVVSAHAGRLPLTYLYEPELGKNHALNRALRQPLGDVVVFADDDITPDVEWLQAI